MVTERFPQKRTIAALVAGLVLVGCGCSRAPDNDRVSEICERCQASGGQWQ